MPTPRDDKTVKQFVIRTSIGSNVRIDESEVYRLIEYLGGTATSDGFAFPTYERRRAVLQELSNKYGPRYFTPWQSE